VKYYLIFLEATDGDFCVKPFDTPAELKAFIKDENLYKDECKIIKGGELITFNMLH